MVAFNNYDMSLTVDLIVVRSLFVLLVVLLFVCETCFALLLNCFVVLVLWSFVAVLFLFSLLILFVCFAILYYVCLFVYVWFYYFRFVLWIWLMLLFFFCFVIDGRIVFVVIGYLLGLILLTSCVGWWRLVFGVLQWLDAFYLLECAVFWFDFACYCVCFSFWMFGLIICGLCFSWFLVVWFVSVLVCLFTVRFELGCVVDSVCFWFGLVFLLGLGFVVWCFCWLWVCLHRF